MSTRSLKTFAGLPKTKSASTPSGSRPPTSTKPQKQTLDPTPSLLLFPTRVETRVLRDDADPKRVWLLIRVYPDQLHVDGFVPELSDEEKQAGVRFWTQLWEADPASLEQLKALAWQELETQAGLRRASWIAVSLTPINWDLSLGQKQGDGPPVFPIHALRQSPVPQPTRAVLLPERWTVEGYRSGARVLSAAGAPIPASLNLSLDPSLSTFPDPRTGLQLDEGLRWQVDFDAAQQVGMALRIDATTLASQPDSRLLDRLVVFGTRSQSGAGQSSSDPQRVSSIEAWLRLLHAHLFTDGLRVVPQGTPTNRPEHDPGQPVVETSRRLLDRILKRPVMQKEEALERLLRATGVGALAPRAAEDGVSPAQLSLAEDAHLLEQQVVRWMNTALWPATLGHYLEVMLKPASSTDGQSASAELLDLSQLDDALIARIRRFFIDQVSGRGPLSVLRIGRQPYGVLPVMPLRELAAQEKASPTGAFLARLMPEWLEASQRVPHVRMDLSAAPGIQVPEQLVTHILAREAVSGDFRLRPVLGGAVVDRLWENVEQAQQKLSGKLEGERDSNKKKQLSAQQKLLPQKPPHRKGDPEAVRDALGKAGLSGAPAITRTLVLRRQLDLEGPLVHSDPVSGRVTFIEQLLKASVDETVNRQGSLSLLQLLLRSSLLLTCERVADELLKSSGQADCSREILDSSVRSILKKLSQPCPADTKQTIGNALKTYLLEGKGEKLLYGTPAPGRFLELKELREALLKLAEQPTSALELALQESLDLCSHRLDAWMTAEAWAALEGRLGAEPRGETPDALMLGSFGWVEHLKLEPLDPNTNPLRGSQSAGFIHAPSLDQAAAAAILRAGHLAHRAQGARDDAYAIDLSSRRVRLAESLLEGVRAGHPLGALLGQRFERTLQELELEQYLDEARRFAPLTVGDGPDAASGPRITCTDGLALHDAWLPESLEKKQDLWRAFGNPTGDEKVKLEAAFRVLDDTFDAVDDALTAESVYQLMQGNPQRAGATLGAIARGDMPAPQLEVTRTHRRGVTLTHRVLLICPPSSGRSSSALATSPRAQAEPGLNALLEGILPPLSELIAPVEVRASDGDAWQVFPCALSELELAPLDLLHLAGRLPDGSCQELERRLALRARLSAGAAWKLDPYSLQARVPGVEALPDALLQSLELVGALRGLAQRALEPEDLVYPGQPATATVDDAELERRWQALERWLPESVIDRQGLQRLSLLGQTGFLPDFPDAELSERCDKANRWLVGLREAAAGLEAPLERIRAVLGEDFKVLPRIQGDLSAVRPSPSLAGAGSERVLEWVQQAGTVRTDLAELENLLLLEEVIRPAPTTPRLTLGVSQQTTGEALEHWAGAIRPEGPPPTGDVLSRVVCAPPAVQATNASGLSGLCIDEWVEVIPLKDVTTGVAMHFNAPDAAPPHALLLGVLPPGVAWSEALISAVIQQAADTARIRSVDHRALSWPIRHLLPAVALPHSPAPGVVSSDFSIFI